jgi:hypothetical protein
LSDSADGNQLIGRPVSMEIHVGDLFVNQRFVSVTVQLLCSAARSGLFHQKRRSCKYSDEKAEYSANFGSILKFKSGT